MEEHTIHCGAIHWLHADAPDGGIQAYAHPYVVVQDDVFNHSRITTVVVCALTTNLERVTEPGNVLLEQGEGGLPKRRLVVVSQILSVEKSRLGRGSACWFQNGWSRSWKACAFSSERSWGGSTQTLTIFLDPQNGSRSRKIIF